MTARLRIKFLFGHFPYTLRTLLCFGGLVLALLLFPDLTWAGQQESPVDCDEDIIPEPIPLMYGDHTVGCAISPVAEADRFSFWGEVGDEVRIRVVSLAHDLDPRLEVRDPMGDVILDHKCTSSSVGRCAFTVDPLTDPPLPPLDKSGTYLLIISDDDGFNGGDYLLQIERILPFPPAPILSYDMTEIDELSPSSDVDFFRFDGVAGTEVRIRVVSLAHDLDPRLEVRDPMGDVILDHKCTSSSVGRCAFTVDPLTDPPLPPLDKSGTYLLIISDDDGFNGGGYQVDIQCLFGPCDDIVYPDPPQPLCGQDRSISTLGFIEGEDIVLIGGVIVDPNHGILVRCRMPNVPDSITNPTLTVFDGTTPIEMNDDWQEHPLSDMISPECQPPEEKDAAVWIPDFPNGGVLTAHCKSADGETGKGIVEILLF